MSENNTLLVKSWKLPMTVQISGCETLRIAVTSALVSFGEPASLFNVWYKYGMQSSRQSEQAWIPAVSELRYLGWPSVESLYRHVQPRYQVHNFDAVFLGFMWHHKHRIRINTRSLTSGCTSAISQSTHAIADANLCHRGKYCTTGTLYLSKPY